MVNSTVRCFLRNYDQNDRDKSIPIRLEFKKIILVTLIEKLRVVQY